VQVIITPTARACGTYTKGEVEAAELISLPDSFVPEYSNRDLLSWSKILHFEARYLSINQLIEDIDVDHFLELSSGYSFRCLELSRKRGRFYIDTDLLELIEKKKQMLDSFEEPPEIGNLRLLALNAIDDEQFQKTVDVLPPGRLAVINEGLLIYFDRAEKEKLCHIFRATLKKRGGHWITSDIHVRANPEAGSTREDRDVKAFADRHSVEENKFPSFDEARRFFEDNGFVVDSEENLDSTQLSSYRYLAKLAPPPVEAPGGELRKLQTSWRLGVAN